MAQVKLTDIAKEMNGKYSNDGTILRVKKYRSSNGAIIATGKQEAFRVMNPRDFKRKPAKGAEFSSSFPADTIRYFHSFLSLTSSKVYNSRSFFKRKVNCSAPK